MDIWLKIATVLEYGILILLLALSVWSFAIMIDRRRTLAREQKTEELNKLREAITKGEAQRVREWVDSHPGIHATALKAAQGNSQDTSATKDPAKIAEKIDRSVRAHLIEERLRLEKGLSVLATLGANTPFIGLFGTVLGIIRAFAALGENSGAATSVMSGISQALVATAAGLFVAIPAVVAFNAFSTKLKTLISQSESLKDLYVSTLVKGG
jgi:biopolymer transport protein ExbB